MTSNGFALCGEAQAHYTAGTLENPNKHTPTDTPSRQSCAQADARRGLRVSALLVLHLVHEAVLELAVHLLRLLRAHGLLKALGHHTRHKH